MGGRIAPGPGGRSTRTRHKRPNRRRCARRGSTASAATDKGFCGARFRVAAGAGRSMPEPVGPSALTLRRIRGGERTGSCSACDASPRTASSTDIQHIPCAASSTDSPHAAFSTASLHAASSTDNPHAGSGTASLRTACLVIDVVGLRLEQMHCIRRAAFDF